MPEESHSEQMRRRRLVFYKEDIDKIDLVIEEFLSASQARCALLVDSEGHLVTKKGITSSFDVDGMAALVAGSFASTRALAKLLGESEFSVIFHQGKNENIHIGMVAERSLLVVIFDDRTTVGMVRIYCRELSGQLAAILEAAAARPEVKDGSDLSKGFEQAATERLDEFFKEEK